MWKGSRGNVCVSVKWSKFEGKDKSWKCVQVKPSTSVNL